MTADILCKDLVVPGSLNEIAQAADGTLDGIVCVELVSPAVSCVNCDGLHGGVLLS